jgi:hypothetical protein
VPGLRLGQKSSYWLMQGYICLPCTLGLQSKHSFMRGRTRIQFQFNSFQFNDSNMPALRFGQEPVDDYLEEAINTVVQIHSREPAGDILVFLIWETEIEDACKKIKSEVSQMGDEVCSFPI